MKRCPRCGVVKVSEEFFKNRSRPDGLQPWCSSCKMKHNLKNKPEDPRTGVCRNCGETFTLLAKTRKYCSNKCKSAKFGKEDKRALWKLDNPEKIILYRTKSVAKKNGVKFDLSVEDIFIPKFCPVLGIELSVGKEKAHDNSPSIDKIKPELGYVKGNVRIISQRANLLKSNATLEELEKVYKDALTRTDTTLIKETEI